MIPITTATSDLTSLVIAATKNRKRSQDRPERLRLVVRFHFSPIEKTALPLHKFNG